MKKRVLAAMLAGVMVLGLAGCGGSSDDKKEDAKTEDTAKDEDKESDGEQFEDTLGSTDENHSSDFILQSAPAAEGYLL